MDTNENLFQTNLSNLLNNLLLLLNNVTIVYVIPHKKMDFDALASAAAMVQFCEMHGKKAFIVTDDDVTKMESNLRNMYDRLKERYPIINTEMLNKIRTHDELLITVDTNKEYLIPVSEELDTFANIVVIDHHKTDEHTINSNLSLINTSMSSASEIMLNLLTSSNVPIDSYLAHCLLAGIYLDTDKLQRNFKKSTSMAVFELMNLGADSNEVTKLFLITNFESDRKKQKLIDKLIDNTKIEIYNIAITYDDENPNAIYEEETLAETADSLLKYTVDAAFVIGFIDKAELGEGHKNLIAVKARSKDKVDVSEIMHALGGGGQATASACLIECDNIKNVEAALREVIKPGFSIESNDFIKNKEYLLKN